jgi:hypothetical protein
MQADIAAARAQERAAAQARIAELETQLREAVEARE